MPKQHITRVKSPTRRESAVRPIRTAPHYEGVKEIGYKKQAAFYNKRRPLSVYAPGAPVSVNSGGLL